MSNPSVSLSSGPCQPLGQPVPSDTYRPMSTSHLAIDRSDTSCFVSSSSGPAHVILACDCAILPQARGQGGQGQCTPGPRRHASDPSIKFFSNQFSPTCHDSPYYFERRSGWPLETRRFQLCTHRRIAPPASFFLVTVQRTLVPRRTVIRCVNVCEGWWQRGIGGVRW